MTYRQALDWLWGLTDYERRSGYDYSAARFDLQRVRDLLQLLGDPQKGMRLVHVAGTKGKGSTSAMLAAIYRAAGLRTGLYTSPHLHTVRERMQVDGTPIRREGFSRVMAEVASAVERVEGITSFEALTAAGLLCFRQAGVDVAVLEVGMGGRLDATNVVEPFVSVITSISRDHTATLGDSLQAIAAEKAGIIKRGVPVVSAGQAPEVADVLAGLARETQSPLEWVGCDWGYAAGAWSDTVQSLSLQPPVRFSAAASTYRTALLGEHQIENAVLALAAASHTPPELGVGPAHWRDGLESVRWPGRLELVAREPYVVLDGAHNDDSFRRLGQALDRHFPHERLHLVFGASRDKDLAAMLEAIRRPGLAIYGCRSGHGRSAELDAIAEASRLSGLEAARYESVPEALWAAVAAAEPGDCVCVAGSLFVVAAAREAIAARHGWLQCDDDECEVMEVARNWRPALVRA